MSLRRTVELNFKERLSRVFAGSKYKVLEGVSREDRPNPCVIVVAGEGVDAFSDVPNSLGNYTCDLSIIIMSSIDIDSVSEHNDAIEMVLRELNTRDARKVSLVEKLYLYDLVKTSVGEANDEANRKIGAVINYRVTLNYAP